MANVTNTRELSRFKSAHPATYEVILRADFDDGSDVMDGANPGTDVGTWSYAATGALTFTFAEGREPHYVLAGMAFIETADADQRVVYTGYTLATRKATCQVYSIGGTPAAVKPGDNNTFVLILKCSNSDLHTA
mgnify:CR=1 FL=1